MKYPRTFHLSFSPGATSDDRIANSVESLLGKEIVMTEKLDGSNTGMENEGVYGRSHAEFTENPWHRKVVELHNVKVRGLLADGEYIFGEGLEAIHSIEYSNLDSPFYMFGLRRDQTWASWSEIEEYSYLLDIPTVPALFKGIVDSEKELRDLVESISTKKSALGGQREGIVVRNADSFEECDFSKNVMKWVRANHVTSDKHWTRNWRHADIK